MAKITTKSTQLETVLREMVRDVITEEITEGFGDLAGYDDWKTSAPPDPDHAYAPELEPEPRVGGGSDEPDDQLAAMDQFQDPEYEMSPDSRERMIDALLNMEFQESANKSIPLSTIKEMIRASVRRNMRR